MSRQVPESFPVLRSVVESAWYALHIAADPGGTERAEIWLRRDEDDEAKRRCKSEFTVTRIRETHETLDAVTAKEFHAVYEDLIGFGGHPNQLSITMATGITKTAGGAVYNVDILNPEQLPLLFSLRMAVSTAIGALKTFQLVFPERFTIAGLDLEIKKLIPRANALFKGSTGNG